ncbi:hypothetical protein [Salinicola sp. CR57]|uniref:hypothetical protein n=1 Tax=Salinicola sp. CR57 TaxID=1949086 RepID=UPI000DA1A44D|nr:hypothetical protein [Salinicola sp. CR57]
MNKYPTEAAYLAACKAIEKHRKRADTAELERDALMVRYAALAEELRGIIQDSDGVAGYHLNGDIAAWGEFDIEALLEDPGADAPETSLAQLKARVAAGGFAQGLRQAVRICESYANEHDNEDRAFGARAVSGVMKAQAGKADVVAAGDES